MVAWSQYAGLAATQLGHRPQLAKVSTTCATTLDPGLRPRLDDGADALVPEDHRQLARRPARRDADVGVADADGVDADQHLRVDRRPDLDVDQLGLGFLGEQYRGSCVRHRAMLNGDDARHSDPATRRTRGSGARRDRRTRTPATASSSTSTPRASRFPTPCRPAGCISTARSCPYVPGAELAGVVRSAPAGAHVAAGDRVAALTMLTGAMAEVVAVPADRVFKLPDAVSFEAGAGLLFNDLTVHCALRTRGRLVAGESVLVHGAAGGIGTSTLRLATAWGASRTIAVVSTADKGDVARAAGATDVVLADGFKDAVKELTGGRGVDVVVDPVGGDRFTDSLRSLAAGGRLLVIGFTGGDIPTVKVNRLLLNNVDAVGVGWGAWAVTHPGYLGRAVGRTGATARLRRGDGSRARRLPARAGRRGHRVARGPLRTGQGRRHPSVVTDGVPSADGAQVLGPLQEGHGRDCGDDSDDAPEDEREDQRAGRIRRTSRPGTSARSAGRRTTPRRRRC